MDWPVGTYLVFTYHEDHNKKILPDYPYWVEFHHYPPSHPVYGSMYTNNHIRDYNKVLDWVRENFEVDCYIKSVVRPVTVNFVSKEDMMAFKLRWEI